MEKHGKHRPLVKLAFVAGAAAIAASPAAACRLALVLAMDVSSSVDPTEDALQRQGLAAALRDPDVVAAFFASSDPVAVTVFEWSGRYNHSELAPWTLIEQPSDLFAVADRVSASVRSHEDYPTAMGYALGHAAGLLQAGPRCLFQVIDMAGDGVNNDGFGPSGAYAAFPFQDVVVNGLVVAPGGSASDVDLVGFYLSNVMRGPGAFVEIAASFEDFEDAMRRKLLRELGSQVLGGRLVGPAG